MRLIDADKLMPINAPIAGITRGELTHYEKIVFWKTIYEAPTINVIDRVLEIIDRYMIHTTDGSNIVKDSVHNNALKSVAREVLALKGGEI